MNYASYKELCASPQVQVDFLERAVVLCANVPRDERLPHLGELITVAGNPLSSSKYLQALDMGSRDWDLDEAGDALMRRFTTAAKALNESCPWMNAPNFVLGFEDMPGATDADVDGRVAHGEHTVRSQVQSMRARLERQTEESEAFTPSQLRMR